MGKQIGLHDTMEYYSSIKRTVSRRGWGLRSDLSQLWDALMERYKSVWKLKAGDCKTPKTLLLRLPTINWLIVYKLSFTLIKENVK